MGHMVRWVVVLALVVAAPSAWAREEHEHEHEHEVSTPEEASLTGEVVDVFCYLSHNEKGLGAEHASCAKKCIKGGLPVAIKVGDQLYLASLADHEPANETLADYAGKQVTVWGEILERDGQRFIAVSRVERAD